MARKTYTGTEMTSLMTRIREECGDEAIIISTAQHPGSRIEVRVEAPDRKRRAPQPPVRQGKARRSREEESRQKLQHLLLRQGLEPNIVLELTKDIPAEISKLDSFDKLVTHGLSQKLRFDSTLMGSGRVVALVGPTGVGKTTTVAKIAAKMQAAFDIRVGLISADFFRVGARFHLHSYASLMNARFLGLDGDRPSKEILVDAVKELSDCDLIFVDTPGFSSRDDSRIAALAEQLDFPWIEKMLVLPAPMNEVDLKGVVRAYQPLGYERVIISKVDESGYIGPVINTAFGLQKPISFLTTGQRVPEDIEPASPRRLGWMLTETVH